MIEKSKAVVLKSIKYSESSLILTLYTQAAGRQSYLLNGVRSTKSKQKAGILQPMFLLDVEAMHKPGREMQRLKEFRLAEIYHSIPFDVVKSTMSIFLSEVLYKALQNVEPDRDFFDFIYHSMQYLDSLDEGVANFHLWFLIRGLSSLGYALNNNHTSSMPWFDLKTGSFVSSKPNIPETPNRDLSVYLSDFIGLDLHQLKSYRMAGSMRARMLETLVRFYTLHLDGMGEIRSLQVMREVFH
ncbi:MAG: DNA repair protein RecO [Prolixibacteraceae bacterium]|nr:DNA repair protein RecO [Prolixibacteraceae bacterium]MBN2649562.1 DNA repair protein RecO [Prolixibacteraceae bacterium]